MGWAVARSYVVAIHCEKSTSTLSRLGGIVRSIRIGADGCVRGDSRIRKGKSYIIIIYRVRVLRAVLLCAWQTRRCNVAEPRRVQNGVIYDKIIQYNTIYCNVQLKNEERKNKIYSKSYWWPSLRVHFSTTPIVPSYNFWIVSLHVISTIRIETPVGCTETVISVVVEFIDLYYV